MAVRVGFVVHVMQVAGAEVLVRETIRRLGSAIEPTVFCLDRVGTLGEEFVKEGGDLVCLNRRPGRDWCWRSESPHLLRGSVWFLEQRNG